MKKSIIVFLLMSLFTASCENEIVRKNEEIVSEVTTVTELTVPDEKEPEIKRERMLGDFFDIEYEEGLISEECARNIVSYLYAVQNRDTESFSAFYHPVQLEYLERSLNEADCTMQDFVDYYYSKIAKKAGYEFRFSRCRLMKTSDDSMTAEYAEEYLMEFLDNLNVLSKEEYGKSVRFKDAYVLGCDGFVEIDGENVSVMQGIFLIITEDENGYYFALRE